MSELTREQEVTIKSLAHQLILEWAGPIEPPQ